jgi:hypothetical protein
VGEFEPLHSSSLVRIDQPEQCCEKHLVGLTHNTLFVQNQRPGDSAWVVSVCLSHKFFYR